MKTRTTIIALFFLYGAASAQSVEPLPVFAPFVGRPALRSAATPEMRSPRWITPRLDVLDSAGVGQRLLFEFSGKHRYVGVVESVTRRREHGYTLTGSLGNTTSGYFIISRQEEALAGIFQVPADAFLSEMRFAGGKAHWLYEVDERQRKGCAGTPKWAVDGDAAPAVSQPAEGGDDVGIRGGRSTSCPPLQPVHDYLVAYTDLARAGAGGTNAIQAIIQTDVAWACMAYANSSINLRMRLVHCAEVVYDEVVPPGTDEPRTVHLARLIDPSDGIIDEIHAWRDTYHADAVMLMLHTGSGGLAWCCADEAHAFAVMHWHDAARTLAHEFGHNQGCDHNPANVVCGGCFSYSRAHVFTGNNSVEYGTILSYLGTGIPNFSNPNVLHQGQPTGISDQRDNARTISERRFSIEGLRLTRFDIWVDFNGPGPFGIGTPASPYVALTDAVNAVPPAQSFSEMPKLWIEAGTTQETLTIDKPMILNACGGTVRIGG